MVEQKGAKRGREPKYVQPVQSVSHGETEVTGVIKGRMVKIEQKGEEVHEVEQARVIVTPDGSSEVVVGGLNQPVTVYEAGKIADDEIKKKLRNARKRATAERKRKNEALKKTVKKGNSEV